MLGSLIYLYVIFAWYSSGAAAGTWLGAAQFFAPFVAAVAVLGSISMFFMSLGAMKGMMSEKVMLNTLWKCLMITGISVVIVSAEQWGFYPAIAGFVLTYIGAILTGM